MRVSGRRRDAWGGWVLGAAMAAAALAASPAAARAQTPAASPAGSADASPADAGASPADAAASQAGTGPAATSPAEIGAATGGPPAGGVSSPAASPAASPADAAASPEMELGGSAGARAARGRSGEITGESALALPGLARVGAAGPLDRGVVVAAQLGYGYTGAVLGMHDAHQRAKLKLAATYRPRSWLALGATFDERYDMHSGDAGTDSGWVGDPRLLAELARQIAPQWGIGGRATLWLPGENAPSIDVSAASLDLLGLASYEPGGGALSLHVNAGARIGNSAASVPDPNGLSAADRLALGVSAANALLVGAGAAWRMGAGELYAEWSWDLYFGAQAPPASETPMRIDGGGRIAFGDRYDAFGTVEVDTSRRPSVAPNQPLVPIEPRVSVLFGLSARFATGGVRALPAPAAPGTLVGRVQTADGAPVAGAEVEAGGVSATVAADGRFELRGVRAGRRDVTATADGYKDASAIVAVKSDGTARVTLTLARELPPGQVRGVVQSFAGKPLAARIQIQPSGVWVQTDKLGSFSADLAPGNYEVIVTAKGYVEQRSKIRIEENGVTILNVDLRHKR